MIKLGDIYTKIIEDIQPPKYTLYCDMDGVLCDFEKRFEDLTGLTPKEFRSKNGLNKFWKIIDDDGVRFWVGMSWMPDGKQLYNYIKPNLYSLLSSPSFDNSSRLGKRLWVRNNMPGVRLTLAQARNKQNYAAPNHILIDDRKSNIDQWRAQGGIGILHTSADDTISQLKKLG